MEVEDLDCTKKMSFQYGSDKVNIYKNETIFLHLGYTHQYRYCIVM